MWLKRLRYVYFCDPYERKKTRKTKRSDVIKLRELGEIAEATLI